MKPFKLGFALGAAMLASAGVTIAQQAQPPLIKVGFEYGSPPLYFVEPKTFNPTGALVDVVSAVAKDAGFRIEWHGMAAIDRLAFHSAKIVDVSVGQYTPERLAIADATDAVYSVGDALFVLKSDPKEYKTLDDFKGEVVIVGAALADQMRGTGTFKEVVTKSGADNYQAVISGQAKAGFINFLALSDAIGNYPELRMVPTYQPRFNNPGGFLVNKGQPDLVKKINASIAKLKADGTLKAIFAKYGIAEVVAK